MQLPRSKFSPNFLGQGGLAASLPGPPCRALGRVGTGVLYVQEFCMCRVEGGVNKVDSRREKIVNLTFSEVLIIYI